MISLAQAKKEKVSFQYKDQKDSLNKLILIFITLRRNLSLLLNNFICKKIILFIMYKNEIYPITPRISR